MWVLVFDIRMLILYPLHSYLIKLFDTLHVKNMVIQYVIPVMVP